MGNVNMEAYQVHYRGDESVADHLRKIDLDVEKAAALPGLPTAEGKTVLTAVTDSQGDTELTYEAPEVEGEDIAPTFSEETAYSEGDLVYYEGILYKFTADHTAGSWDPSEVTQTSAAAEFNELKNTLTTKGQLDWSQATEVTLPYTPTATGQLIVSGVATGGNGTLSVSDYTASLTMFTAQVVNSGTALGANVMTVAGHEYRAGTFNATIEKVVFVPVI